MIAIAKERIDKNGVYCGWHPNFKHCVHEKKVPLVAIGRFPGHANSVVVSIEADIPEVRKANRILDIALDQYDRVKATIPNGVVIGRNSATDLNR